MHIPSRDLEYTSSKRGTFSVVQISSQRVREPVDPDVTQRPRSELVVQVRSSRRNRVTSLKLMSALIPSDLNVGAGGTIWSSAFQKHSVVALHNSFADTRVQCIKVAVPVSEGGQKWRRVGDS